MLATLPRRDKELSREYILLFQGTWSLRATRYQIKLNGYTKSRSRKCSRHIPYTLGSKYSKSSRHAWTPSHSGQRMSHRTQFPHLFDRKTSGCSRSLFCVCECNPFMLKTQLEPHHPPSPPCQGVQSASAYPLRPASLRRPG